MRVLTSTLVAVALAAVGACGDAATSDATAVADVAGDTADVSAAPVWVRVATYNVRTFWDTRCDSDFCGGNSFEQVPSAAEFGARADQITDAIRALEADVVLLQEIESQESLDALTTRLGSELPHGVLGETGFSGSLDVAVLSRWPVLTVVTHQDTPIPHPQGGTTRFTRELLEVHLDVDGDRLIAMVAHFKSKFDDDPWRRVAEAGAARELVVAAQDAHPDAVVVFGGDLNDTPGSVALDVLEKNGDLFRLASSLSPDAAWTIIFEGNAQAIDHLYVPTSKRAVLVPDTVSVLRRGGFGGWGGSDHAAVRAILDLARTQ